MMNRKHFQAFTDRIKWIEDTKEKETCILLVCSVCKQFNSNFKEERFREACKSSPRRDEE